MAGFLAKLFGKSEEKSPARAVETYKGFEITATPQKATGGYRIGARIERDADGARLTHDLVRADVIQDLEAAEAASIAKARQMIDEQGARLFD